MEDGFKKSIIAKRAFQFAIDVIILTKILEKSYENIIFIKQIIRSSTSIGANIEEALGSNTRKEFTHSMNIAKKEARETIYWLKMIQAINKNVDRSILLQENKELINMLTKIVKSSSVQL